MTERSEVSVLGGVFSILCPSDDHGLTPRPIIMIICKNFTYSKTKRWASTALLYSLDYNLYALIINMRGGGKTMKNCVKQLMYDVLKYCTVYKMKTSINTYSKNVLI